jgi:translation initiation factor IF-1
MQFEGLVIQVLPDACFRVQLDAGHEIVAYTAGRMEKSRIKTLAGDRVTIGVSHRIWRRTIDLSAQGRACRHESATGAQIFL